MKRRQAYKILLSGANKAARFSGDLAALRYRDPRYTIKQVNSAWRIVMPGIPIPPWKTV